MSIAHHALATAARLPDQALLARVHALAGNERAALAELVAHLAELDTRRALYAAEGYGSLFGYCTKALRLSEDAAYNRIEAARACRRFPVVLDLLAAGEVTLTTIRLLGRHLTAENHRALLAAARGRGKAEIEEIVARVAPRPDLPSVIRRLPSPPPVVQSAASPPGQVAVGGTVLGAQQLTAEAPSARDAAPVAPPRASVRPSAPERFHVQFTISGETREKLRRLQDLLAREVPGGDPAVIFDRALDVLLEKVEKRKLAAAARPRRTRSRTGGSADGSSRHVPADVRRAVWRRDRGQCAFVAAGGSRCIQRRYLELHHLQPYAHQGPATVQNIALRCRLHNVYEAERVFGPERVGSHRKAGDRRLEGSP